MLKFLGVLNLVLLLVFFVLLARLYFREMEEGQLVRVVKVAAIVLGLIVTATGVIHFSL